MRFRLDRTSTCGDDTNPQPHPRAVKDGAVWVVDVTDLADLLDLAGDERLIVSPREDGAVIEIYDDYRE
jgi:hypothetical protein